MKNIAIYGAGGFGQEIACALRVIPEWKEKWNFIGYFDDSLKKNHTIYNDIILGNLEELNKWSSELDIVICIGDPHIVEKISLSITNPYISFPNLIRPEIFFYKKEDFIIGKGNILNARAISCNVKIGDFNCFNGDISIGHDTAIGSYNIIMPSVNISGNASIGNKNFIGVSATILQGIKIGENVKIGAGGVLMRNTKDFSLYIGNPALKIKL